MFSFYGLDVLCCSASILHLLAVALDRFWAVSRINWTVNRNVTHINLMILLVWLVAFLVSVAPLLGWKDPHFQDRIEDNRCMVSPDVGYQVFATVSTFYAPTVLIFILYWKIWQTAKTRIRHRVGKANNHKLPTSTSTTTIGAAKTAIPLSSTFSADELATVETSTESVMASPTVAAEGQEMEQLAPPAVASSVITCDDDSGVNPSIGPSDNLRPPCSPFRASQASLSSPDLEANSSNQISNSNKHMKDLQKQKETLEAKRERKAAKTLAVITGCFMVCWGPFFLQVLIMALCTECWLPEYIANAFQWLGYINSTLNPVIYTIFNAEFRQAFKRILFGRQHKTARRRH
ncbi:5-hydroxytryptamine receptor [Folsomia candida]|uniref:5-hydroxytryptamine receptor n=1 Tax=Folsomia candida TaxID=158441 RepID=A0A226EI24_FOLCA|nr:5-hydroxytryptamine receptor [Folsomia candida]